MGCNKHFSMLSSGHCLQHFCPTFDHCMERQKERRRQVKKETNINLLKRDVNDKSIFKKLMKEC